MPRGKFIQILKSVSWRFSQAGGIFPRSDGLTVALNDGSFSVIALFFEN